VKDKQIKLSAAGGNPAPGGFLLDEQHGRIYLTLSRNNSLAIVDVSKGTVEFELPVGIAPYTVVRRGDKAYVSNWGGRRPGKDEVTGPTSGSRAVVDPRTGVASTGTVSVIDSSRTPMITEIEVGLHPCAMALSPDESRLYVVNANSDSVSVIDTASDKCVDTFDVKPMKELPFGSAPNAITVSPDGSTLYVANGGNNAIAVLDAANGSIKGFIPAGWYPGAVTLAGGGRLLCVANVKGVGSLYEKTNPELKRADFPGISGGHNSHDVLGSVTFVEVPDQEKLAGYTVRVGENMRLPLLNKEMHLKNVTDRVVPVPHRPGEVSVFKHVIYIIKENRTYDQVLGDMPRGNGEPKFCQFGREVTPNHHALAEEFVLFDNFYCNGQLSADGHQWTDEGYATDYLEKSFGGFPRSYPYDGEDALAFAPNGFIWEGQNRPAQRHMERYTGRSYARRRRARAKGQRARIE
jgi:YVTN family beta-propeller protein